MLARILLFLCASAAFLASASESDRLYVGLFPSFTSGSYWNTTSRDSIMSSGLYSYLGDGDNQLLEFGTEFTQITYFDKADLQQFDYTLSYSHYFGSSVQLFAAGHLVSSNDSFSDQTWVAAIGGKYMSWRWSTGVDFYYSQYPEAANSMVVYQYSPNATIYLYRNKLSSSWITIAGDGILFDRTPIGYDVWEFYSGSLTAGWANQHVSINLTGWYGEQLFTVRNGGFLVYNLPTLYEMGARAKIGYAFDETYSLSVILSWDQFKELSGPQETYLVTGTVMLGMKF